MKGTAILFQEDQITYIEDIEHSVYREMKEQSGYNHCTFKVNDKLTDFGFVSPVFWHEDEIDWDYGY